MKICFNQATTMKHSTLEKDLKICEEAGFDLIEIRLDKLRDYLRTGSTKSLSHFFLNNRIKPYAFNALEFITFRDEKSYKAIQDDLKFLCEIGSEISCKKIIVVPTFDVGESTITQIKQESMRVLNELADISEEYDVKLAYEFVGYPNCSVNTFGQTYDIVKDVERDNVGLVLDCFHFHAMGSRIEHLQQADPAKIFVFHIDDSEDLPVGSLRDHNRLWPGDGAIDLDMILGTLKKIGYNDMVSVELFRPEYWEWDVEKAIKTSKEKTVKIVGKYFAVKDN